MFRALYNHECFAVVLNAWKVYNQLMIIDNDTVENELYIYNGQTKDHIPHGHGKMTYLNDDYFFEYEGDFVEGNEEGKGRQVTADGVYVGEFVGGSAKGSGRFIFSGNSSFSEGDVCEGTFDNVAEGQCVMHYANGDTYEGSFKGGFPYGLGKLTYADDSVYEGEFDEVPSGYGKLTYSDGSFFEGQFEYGMPV